MGRAVVRDVARVSPVGAYFKGELFNIPDAELQIRVKDAKVQT